MVVPVGPAINYTESSDGAKIAYSVMGAGPALVILPNPPTSHFSQDWLLKERRSFYERLSHDVTVVRYDCRGAGLSQREVGNYSIEAHLADLDVVTSAAGVPRFALYASFYAGPIAIRYAAEHPEKVSRLILYHTFARTAEYLQKPQLQILKALIAQDWNLYTQATAHALIGWNEGARAAEQAKLIQNSISGETYQTSFKEVATFDATACLSAIQAPTLVLRREGFEPVDLDMTRALASSIHNSRLFVLEGDSGTVFLNDARSVASLIASFVIEDEDTKSKATPDSDVDLTPREIEILRLVSTGLRSKEIAQQLGLSVHTIERHVSNTYRKIGAHGRADAASYAIKHNLA